MPKIECKLTVAERGHLFGSEEGTSPLTFHRTYFEESIVTSASSDSFNSTNIEGQFWLKPFHNPKSRHVRNVDEVLNPVRHSVCVRIACYSPLLNILSPMIIPRWGR